MIHDHLYDLDSKCYNICDRAIKRMNHDFSSMIPKNCIESLSLSIRVLKVNEMLLCLTV